VNSIKYYINWLTHNKLIRFLFVGGVNTIFGYGVYALLLWIGLHYTLATLLGTIISVLFNFKTYGTIVFKNKNNTLILRFVLMYAFIYFLNNVWLFIAKNYLDITPYIAGLIWLIPGALLSFFISHKFVYVKKKATSK
jgi:putative flippase GtrA